MDPAWYRLLVQELAQPLGEIADNLGFILGELPKLDLAGPTRQRVAAICEQFRAAIEQEKRRPAEALGAKTGGIGAEDLAPALEHVAARIDEQVRAFDAVVREVSGTGSWPILEVLLKESGVNILAARKNLHDRVGRLAADPPERTEERHVLACSVCTQPAVVFDVNADSRTERRLVRMEGLTRAQELPLHDDLLASVRAKDAAALHRHVPEGIDAYCPECDRVYCREHYRMDAEYDDGFYDCTYGTCPAGHRRMIDD